MQNAPTYRGLVIPFVTACHINQPVWGYQDPIRYRLAAELELCQICGRSLRTEDRVVIYLRPYDLDLRLAPELGMHPACAAYSRKACPMLAGKTDHYATRSQRRLGRCNEPGCHCHGWAPLNGAATTDIRSGMPADAWYAYWLPVEKYSVCTLEANDSHPAITGVDLRGVSALKVRKIRDTADPSQDRTGLEWLSLIHKLL
ncbi:hypothetical protein ACIHDR_46785 [Nocardia sp. NPDC052278]|uniref:hypothetical protein n=1 Tax=unclassified Nocardia TaxID=2637762 RepID=UPI0036CB6A4D